MSFIENIIIYGNILAELNIDGFNFTKVTSSIEGDSSIHFLGFDSLDLSRNSNFYIKSITISDCNAAFLSFNKVNNQPASNSSLIISDFQFSDSTFQDSNNLISFKKLEQEINFQIIMENIVFNNITFNQAGNLLLFQQQLSNYLSISNLTISSVYNAGIMLKSSNKLNINLPVKVAIQSLTASSNKFDMNSFITVSDNAILNITGSTISRWSTSGSGASLSAIAPYSIVNIDSSTIRSNTAAQGGAFYADNYGVIRVYNSLIQRNNASISGVIWLTNNGRFEFYGWNITQNTAIDAPIARLFDSTYFSIINNCVISNNTIGSLNGSNTYPIQLISSSILITNSTDIFGQFSILNAFLSTVTLENSIIENCEFDDAAFNIIGTIFTISNIQLDSDTIYSDNSLNSLANAKLIQYILQISMYCQVYISNVTYTNSNLALVLIQQSSSIISDLSVSSVISNGLIKIENSQNSTIMNVNINSYISRNPISFTNSYSYLIENITATGVNGSKSRFVICIVVIRFTGCKVFKINNVNIFNINNKVMYFKDSQITLMSNLTIYNNALSSYAAASLATKTINGIIYFRNSKYF